MTLNNQDWISRHTGSWKTKKEMSRSKIGSVTPKDTGLRKSSTSSRQAAALAPISSPKAREATSWTRVTRGSIHSWKRTTNSSSSVRVSSWMRGERRFATTRLSQSTAKAMTVATTTRATLVTRLISQTELRVIEPYQR